MYLVWLCGAARTNIPDLPPRWGLLFVFAYIAGAQPHPAGFHQQLRSAPVLAILGEVVFVGHRFHRRAGLVHHSYRGTGVAGDFSRHEPLPRGRTAATVAAVCVLALYAARDYEHRRAVHALGDMEFQAGAEFRSGATARVQREFLYIRISGL